MLLFYLYWLANFCLNLWSIMKLNPFLWKAVFGTVSADLWRYQLASIYGLTLWHSLIKDKCIIRDLVKMQAGPFWAPPVIAITVSFLWVWTWASSLGKWEILIPLLKVPCGNSCRGLKYWCGCSPEWKIAFLQQETEANRTETFMRSVFHSDYWALCLPQKSRRETLLQNLANN